MPGSYRSTESVSDEKDTCIAGGMDPEKQVSLILEQGKAAAVPCLRKTGSGSERADPGGLSFKGN